MKEIMGEFIDMKNISTLIPDIKQEMLPDDEEEKKYAHIRYKERYYKAEIMKVCIDDFTMDNKVVELQPEAYQLFAFYLFDETEIQMSRKEIQNQKLICGIILVDNYEEALNSTEEVRRSLLSALVERKITKYMQNYECHCQQRWRRTSICLSSGRSICRFCRAPSFHCWMRSGRSISAMR